MKKALLFITAICALSAMGQEQGPNCSFECPVNIIVQTNEGMTAVVEYNLDFNCEPIPGKYCAIAYPGNNFEKSLPNSNFTTVANDFDVPEGETYSIKGLEANFVRYSYGCDVYLYNNNNGKPGSLITSFTNVQFTSQTEIGILGEDSVYEVKLDLPTSSQLSAGKYWVALNAQGPLIYWESTSDDSTAVSYTTTNQGNSWVPNQGYNGVFKMVFECDGSEGVEASLVSGLASGSEFPVGTTVVTHNIMYNQTVIDTCSFSVTVENTMGIDEVNKTSVMIYPNPATDTMNISHNDEISHICIYDLSGREVYKQVIEDKSATITTSHLASGVYILNSYIGDKMDTIKIVKK